MVFPTNQDLEEKTVRNDLEDRRVHQRGIALYTPEKFGEQRFASVTNGNLFRQSSSDQSPANPSGGPFDDMWKPERLELIWQNPLPDRNTMEAHAWNPKDSSPNIYVTTDPLTFHRLPIAQSTDCIRGKVGYSNGFHVWEIIWPVKRRGTHAVIGVATKDASLHSCGYMSLVGYDDESYGWDLIRRRCLHGSKSSSGWAYPTVPLDDEPGHTVPDRVLCILDMDNGYLAFSSHRQYYGVAFTGLKGKELYPVVSAVWGHCEITIRYLGGLKPEPRSLLDICRGNIRMMMGTGELYQIEDFELPQELITYLLHL